MGAGDVCVFVRAAGLIGFPRSIGENMEYSIVRTRLNLR